MPSPLLPELCPPPAVPPEFFDCSGLQQNTDSTQIKEASEYQKLSIGRVASSHQNPADHRCKNANHKHELIPKGIDIVSLPQ